jgi:hypothetical protein
LSTTRYASVSSNCAKISSIRLTGEAQTILIRCGAVSYCVDQLLNVPQSLPDAGGIPACGREMEKLFDDLILPSSSYSKSWL